MNRLNLFLQQLWLDLPTALAALGMAWYASLGAGGVQ